MKGHSKRVRPIVMIGTIILAVSMISISISGCKSSTPQVLETIFANLAQTQWNLNYTSSSGKIEVFLVGEGIENIILDTIAMKGDNPSAEPLKADSASFDGDRVIARFPKNQVISLLLNPTSGSTHILTVVFYMSQRNEPQEVVTQITISSENSEALTLEIDPAEWNLNFTKSSGTVEAFIRGEGIDEIDLNSIQMKGDNPSSLDEPLSAISATRQGDHIHARFPKNQVIDLLLDPAVGTTHTIIVSVVEIDGTERLELTAEITIIEDEDDDGIDPSELTLEIDPDEWNLNFTKSSGTVEAFIMGEGIDKIDLDSIQMMGDNPNAVPLSANSARLKGDHIHARFPKNQVIDLLLNPAEGTTHTIIISFLEIDGTERMELSAEITIEDDDDDDDEIDPTTLTLQLAPPQWNMNFSKNSGTVNALIRGQGIENIDLDSIEMMGDNPDAVPLPAISASLQGNHVQARFPKNQVLDLLLNPAPGTVHTVTVTFEGNQGGGRLEVSTEVTITGKSD
jgi:putative sterol carrier protein